MPGVGAGPCSPPIDFAGEFVVLFSFQGECLKPKPFSGKPPDGTVLGFRSLLLAHLVVPLALVREHDLFAGTQLRMLEIDRQLVELASEPKWHLIVLLVHRRASIHTHVEGVIPLEDERNCVFEPVLGDLLAVHLQHAETARVGSGRAALGCVVQKILVNILAFSKAWPL